MLIGNLFGGDGVIVVIVLAVVLFGGAAIPKLARSLGSAKTEFEKGIKGDAKSNSEEQQGDSPESSDTPSQG
jgi:sec-independent protein translocase protein TatA